MPVWKLTAIKSVHAKPRRKWLCHCDCGGTTIVVTAHLRNGNTKSCGCESPFIYKHGLSDSQLMTKYYDMKRRCYSPKCWGYQFYGSRGIKVCDEWKNDSMTFYKWALSNGYHKNLELDRIDPNGDYNPNNCRFITKLENNRNRRNVLNSRAKKARDAGLCPETVQSRIQRGWTVKRALSEPVIKRGNP
jgi:hypothetical protein